MQLARAISSGFQANMQKNQSESLPASSDLPTENLVSVLDLHGMTDVFTFCTAARRKLLVPNSPSLSG